jgi:hypothetical protein
MYVCIYIYMCMCVGAQFETGWAHAGCVRPQRRCHAGCGGRGHLRGGVLQYMSIYICIYILAMYLHIYVFTNLCISVLVYLLLLLIYFLTIMSYIFLIVSLLIILLQILQSVYHVT